MLLPSWCDWCTTLKKLNLKLPNPEHQNVARIASKPKQYWRKMTTQRDLLQRVLSVFWLGSFFGDGSGKEGAFQRKSWTSIKRELFLGGSFNNIKEGLEQPNKETLLLLDATTLLMRLMYHQSKSWTSSCQIQSKRTLRESRQSPNSIGAKWQHKAISYKEFSVYFD